MKEYKEGDKVYYITDGYLLLIKCTIVEIDNAREPQAYSLYYLDEPIGHGVIVDELFETKELALSELEKRYNELISEGTEPYLIDMDIQLQTYRERRVDFIIESHQELSEYGKQRVKEKTLKDSRNKEYNKEWFNLKSILKD